jgi:cobalt-zinc-cadmium efflux system outer membrane protein
MLQPGFALEAHPGPSGKSDAASETFTVIVGHQCRDGVCVVTQARFPFLSLLQGAARPLAAASLRSGFLRSGCCALLLALAMPCAGQVPPRSLSLEQALALAEKSSPRLRIAEAQLAAVQAAGVTAGQYPNPEAELLVGPHRARVAGASSGTAGSFALSQPLELPSVRAARASAAQSGVLGGLLAREDARLMLRTDVKLAYFDLIRRKAELDLQLDTQSLLEQVRRRIEVQVSVGEAPRLELSRVEAEVAGAVMVGNAARLRLTQATAALRLLIGLPQAESFEVSGVFPALPALPDAAQLRNQVFLRHPQLQQARAELARAQARLDQERALRGPAPTLRAAVDQDPDMRQLRFGFSLPLPLWNQRQGQIGEARAALSQAAAVLEQRQLEFAAALEYALNRYRVAGEQVVAFDGGALRQAEAAVKVAEAAYRFGERGFIEVLDAQRVLRRLRLDFLEARYEQQAALVEIDRLRALDMREIAP